MVYGSQVYGPYWGHDVGNGKWPEFMDLIGDMMEDMVYGSQVYGSYWGHDVGNGICLSILQTLSGTCRIWYMAPHLIFYWVFKVQSCPLTCSSKGGYMLSCNCNPGNHMPLTLSWVLINTRPLLGYC